VTERLRIRRLRALSQRLLEVQEDERRSLARDRTTTSARHGRAQDQLSRSRSRAASRGARRGAWRPRATAERVRQLSLNLRPLQLDDLGLVAALRSHLDRQAGLGGLAPHFDAGEAPPQLDPETETACFRVAQEAITNVLRHAHARNLWLRLFTAGDRLALSVRDDGNGFDPDSARRRAHAGGSLGLAGMEERIAIAGGSIELRSQPGHGTVLLAHSPSRAGGGA
jgi:two-component system sensor histidine kinase UhpB